MQIGPRGRSTGFSPRRCPSSVAACPKQNRTSTRRRRSKSTFTSPAGSPFLHQWPLHENGHGHRPARNAGKRIERGPTSVLISVLAIQDVDDVRRVEAWRRASASTRHPEHAVTPSRNDGVRHRSERAEATRRRRDVAARARLTGAHARRHHGVAASARDRRTARSCPSGGDVATYRRLATFCARSRSESLDGRVGPV